MSDRKAPKSKPLSISAVSTSLAEIEILENVGSAALPRLYTLYKPQSFSVKLQAASAICRIERPEAPYGEISWPVSEEARVEFCKAVLAIACGPVEEPPNAG